jgi:hypothetical protein
MTVGVLNLEFVNSGFELVKANVTLLRAGTQESQTESASEDRSYAVDWSATLMLEQGHVRSLTYDGQPGRIHGRFENLEIRRHTDSARYVLNSHLMHHDLTIQEIEAQQARILIPEDIVVSLTLQAEPDTPLPNKTFHILSAFEESVSMQGKTDENGEFLFLARVGDYYVLLDAQARPEILVRAHSGSEVRVALTIPK